MIKNLNPNPNPNPNPVFRIVKFVCECIIFNNYQLNNYKKNLINCWFSKK